jgi:hypothetical protein
MSERRPPGVLGSLPNTRPHRRSEKRPSAAAPTGAETAAAPSAKAAATQPRAKARTTQPKAKAAATQPRAKARATQPKATGKPKPRPKATTAPPQTKRAQQDQPERPTPAGTAVQAAAELAEIGLMAGARALRRALSRLPRR